MIFYFSFISSEGAEAAEVQSILKHFGNSGSVEPELECEYVPP